jgi:hypothetical protein
MAGPQILNLDLDSISRQPGEAVSIDEGNDVVVVAGDHSFHFLDFYFGSYEATDVLGVRTAAGEVEFPDGLAEGKKIVVAGTEIGQVFFVDRGYLGFEFNGQATVELVQKLIRSLTYKDESTETGFTSARYVGLALTDSNFDSAEVLLTVGDSIQGTAAADTVTANEDVIGAADKLDGGGGMTPSA